MALLSMEARTLAPVTIQRDTHETRALDLSLNFTHEAHVAKTQGYCVAYLNGLLFRVYLLHFPIEFVSFFWDTLPSWRSSDITSCFASLMSSLPLIFLFGQW